MCSGSSKVTDSRMRFQQRPFFQSGFAAIQILVVFSFLWVTSQSHAIITNNLVADWQASAGITAPGGLVSQWSDQHQLLNNDGLGPHLLTQTNATFRPSSVTDAHGYAGVMFPWAVPGSHPHTVLNLPSSLGGFDTANMTVYVVATGPFAQENQSLVWFAGQPAGWIKFYQTGNYPANMLVGTQSSSIYPPLNRAVFVGSSDTNATTIRWNNITQTNLPQFHAITTNGGMIAAN